MCRPSSQRTTPLSDSASSVKEAAKHKAESQVPDSTIGRQPCHRDGDDKARNTSNYVARQDPISATNAAVQRLLAAGGKGARYSSRSHYDSIQIKIPFAEPEQLPDTLLNSLTLSAHANGLVLSGAAVRRGCIELVLDVIHVDPTKSAKGNPVHPNGADASARDCKGSLHAAGGTSQNPIIATDGSAPPVMPPSDAFGGGSGGGGPSSSRSNSTRLARLALEQQRALLQACRMQQACKVVSCALPKLLGRDAMPGGAATGAVAVQVSGAIFMLQQVADGQWQVSDEQGTPLTMQQADGFVAAGLEASPIDVATDGDDDEDSEQQGPGQGQHEVVGSILSAAPPPAVVACMPIAMESSSCVDISMVVTDAETGCNDGSSSLQPYVSCRGWCMPACLKLPRATPGNAVSVEQQASTTPTAMMPPAAMAGTSASAGIQTGKISRHMYARISTAGLRRSAVLDVALQRGGRLGRGTAVLVAGHDDAGVAHEVSELGQECLEAWLADDVEVHGGLEAFLRDLGLWLEVRDALQGVAAVDEQAMLKCAAVAPESPTTEQAPPSSQWGPWCSSSTEAVRVQRVMPKLMQLWAEAGTGTSAGAVAVADSSSPRGAHALLAQHVREVGLGLLEFALERGWSHVVRLLTHDLLVRSPAADVDCGDATCVKQPAVLSVQWPSWEAMSASSTDQSPEGLTLLHRALRSGCAHTVAALLAAPGAAEVLRWDTPCSEGDVRPMDIASSLPPATLDAIIQGVPSFTSFMQDRVQVKHTRVSSSCGLPVSVPASHGEPAEAAAESAPAQTDVLDQQRSHGITAGVTACLSTAAAGSEPSTSTAVVTASKKSSADQQVGPACSAPSSPKSPTAAATSTSRSRSSDYLRWRGATCLGGSLALLCVQLLSLAAVLARMLWDGEPLSSLLPPSLYFTGYFAALVAMHRHQGWYIENHETVWLWCAATRMLGKSLLASGFPHSPRAASLTAQKVDFLSEVALPVLFEPMGLTPALGLWALDAAVTAGMVHTMRVYGDNALAAMAHAAVRNALGVVLVAVLERWRLRRYAVVAAAAKLHAD